VPSLWLCLWPSPASARAAPGLARARFVHNYALYKFTFIHSSGTVTSHALLAKTSPECIFSVGCRHPHGIYVFTRIFGRCKPIYICQNGPTNSQAIQQLVIAKFHYTGPTGPDHTRPDPHGLFCGPGLRETPLGPCGSPTESVRVRSGPCSGI